MSIALSHGRKEQVDEKIQNVEIKKIELNSTELERASAESVKIRKIASHTNHTLDPNSVEHFKSKEALQKFKNSKLKKGYR